MYSDPRRNLQPAPGPLRTFASHMPLIDLFITLFARTRTQSQIRTNALTPSKINKHRNIFFFKKGIYSHLHLPDKHLYT